MFNEVSSPRNPPCAPCLARLAHRPPPRPPADRAGAASLEVLVSAQARQAWPTAERFGHTSVAVS